MNRVVIGLVCSVVLSINTAPAASLTVLNTNAGGPGSLKQAILDANTSADLSSISFRIPGDGVKSIRPTNELPAITQPVVIDGYTQTNAAANTLAAGTDAALRVDLDGTDAGPSANGLILRTDGCTVRGLIIRGFGSSGVHIDGGHSNRITGNFIGTDPTGTGVFGNGGNGVWVTFGQGNVIGGLEPSERNVLSGNDNYGAEVVNGTGSVIRGNIIGARASGAAPLPNSFGGVSILGGGFNVIGGTASGAGNLISGNASSGVEVDSSDDNVIQGNIIGLNASQTAQVENGNHGISVDGSGNLIGGTAPASANVIASNEVHGVEILGGTSSGNAILGNRIFGNGFLGIDLGGAGPTLNDEGDADAGANGLQNYPVLSAAASGAADSVIHGSLTSAPATTYRIEFFANDTNDQSGFGEGQFFLGATSTATDGSGVVNFSGVVAASLPPGTFVTATATDELGNTSEFSPAIPATEGIPTNTVILLNGSIVPGQLAVVTNEAQVEIRSPFLDGTIRYTLNGSPPHLGAAYPGPFRVSQDGIITAIAYNATGDQTNEAAPVSVTVLSAPVITAHPESQIAAAGSSAMFTVAADGTAPLLYQWRLNGTNLAGATNAGLTRQNVQPADAGNYSVAVSNAVGTAVSPGASLLVNVAPGFISQPLGANVGIGDSATFCVTNSGTPPLRYQWRHNGRNIPDATNQCHTVAGVKLSDGGSYTVVVANEVEAVTSDPARLIVTVPFSPPGDNFAARQSLTGQMFQVRGTNLGFTVEPPSEPQHAGQPGGKSAWYTWRAPTNGVATFSTAGSTFDTVLAVYTGGSLGGLTEVAGGEDAGGFLTSELRFSAIMGTDYSIAIDGFAGAQGHFALDGKVQPTPGALPVITSAPTNQTVTPGATATLSVTATGPGLIYQWHFNGTAVAGATASALLIAGVQSGDVGFYTVAITNNTGLGLETSAVALELGSKPGPVSVDKVPRPPTGGGGFVAAAASTVVPRSYYEVGAGSISEWHEWGNGQGTVSPDEENHCDQICRSTRWLYFHATNSGSLVIDTEGSRMIGADGKTNGTVLAAYRWYDDGGYDPAPLDCAIGSQKVRLEAVIDRIYAIAADGLNNSTGSIHLNWTFGTAPSMPVVSVQDIVASPGSTLLIVPPEAQGAPAPAYQWRLNGVPIPGGTNAMLALERIEAAHEGLYTVVASNPVGAVERVVGRVFLELPSFSLLTDTFDSGAEAWSLAQSQRALGFSTNGGNPPGCLVVTADAINETWYWNAPRDSLGDLSSAYGGWLQFDLNESGAVATATNTPLIQLRGGGVPLVYFETVVRSANTPGWKRWRVPLVTAPDPEEGRWLKTHAAGAVPTAEEFLHALSDLSAIWIRGSATARQSARLDNVAVLDARRLKMARSDDGQLLLQWPVSRITYQLVSSESLSFAAWSTNFPISHHATNQGLHQVHLPAGPADRFFELMRAP